MLLDESVVEHIPTDGDASVDAAWLGTIMVEVGADNEGREAAYNGELF